MARSAWRALALWAAAIALAAAAPPPPLPAGRALLGQYGRWGAFRDRAPARCYAIAAPAGGEEGAAFVTVASAPDGAVRSRVAVRLRRPATTAAAMVAGETIALAVRGREAAPAGAPGQRRLAALLRGGGKLAIVGHDARGHGFRDLYPLAGAASAIDAMRLACLQP